MEVTEQLRAAEADKVTDGKMGAADPRNDDAASARAATDKETKRKEKMERDMKELKELLEEDAYENQQKQHSLKEGDEAVKRLEKLLKDQQGATSRAQKDYNGLSDKLTKLQRDLSDAVQNNTNLTQSNANAQIELKAKDDEINCAKLEAGRIGTRPRMPRWENSEPPRLPRRRLRKTATILSARSPTSSGTSTPCASRASSRRRSRRSSCARGTSSCSSSRRRSPPRRSRRPRPHHREQQEDAG